MKRTSLFILVLFAVTSAIFSQSVNKQVYAKVQKRLKEPGVFYTFPESMVSKVNEITEKLQKIPADKFKKKALKNQKSEGRDKDGHYEWYDQKGRKIRWQRWDDSTMDFYYLYEEFDYGVIKCELSNFGTKYFYGHELNGNQFYHKNDWEDATWWKIDSNGHTIYRKEVNGLEHWYFYDDDGELLYSKDSNGEEYFRKIYEGSNDFFGFNSWTHEEEDISDSSRSYSVTRTVFDNGKYYMYTSENTDIVTIENCNTYPFYASIYIYFLQEKASDRFVELVENAGNFQTYYNFSKSGKKISLEIKGDGKGEISDYTCKFVGNEAIIIKYKIERTYYDYWGEEVIGKGTYLCTETFSNAERRELSELLVKQLDSLIYSKEKDKIKNLKEDVIPNLNKQGLRIARNLIFARHGYAFKSKDLKNLFSSFDWYEAKTSDSESIVLTEDEKTLVELIKNYEKKGK